MNPMDILSALTSSGEQLESFNAQDQALWEYQITNLMYTGMTVFSIYYFVTQ